jgi:hypothetical protein
MGYSTAAMRAVTKSPAVPTRELNHALLAKIAESPFEAYAGGVI